MNSMIRSLLFSLSAILILSCSTPDKNTTTTYISGTVIDRSVDSLYLFKATQDPRQKPEIIRVVNSEFSYSFDSDVIETYEIIFPYQLKGGSWMPHRFFSDKDSLFIKLYTDQLPEITGGTNTTEFASFQLETTNTVQTKIDSIYAVLEELVADGATETSPEIIELNTLIEQSVKEFYLTQWDYVSDHKTPASYYMLYTILRNSEQYPVTIEDIEEEFIKYAQAFPAHPYTSIIKTKLRALKTAVPGGKFIDFSLPDIDGNVKTLSTLMKGKTVLLNLWASWCGPCIEKSRDMVSVFEEFDGEEFTIIGIAREFNDTSKMRSALDREEFPWLNLVDLDDTHDVWRSYNIPFSGGGMFLIDENGIIVSVDPTASDVREYLSEQH